MRALGLESFVMVGYDRALWRMAIKTFRITLIELPSLNIVPLLLSGAERRRRSGDPNNAK